MNRLEYGVIDVVRKLCESSPGDVPIDETKAFCEWLRWRLTPAISGGGWHLKQRDERYDASVRAFAIAALGNDMLQVKVADLEKEVYDLKVALSNAETALEIAKEQLEDALNEVSTYKYY